MSEAQAMLEADADPLAVRVIIIVADGDGNTNAAELTEATNYAKESGTAVAVINAGGDNWTGFASNSDLSLEVQQFDSVEFSFFIRKSLCRGKSFHP